MIENDEGKTTIPIEDITAIILESPQITLTSSFLALCQEHSVVIITCDEKHMPNGILLSFQRHSRQSQIAHIQQSISQPFKKRLWQKIIQAKIINQASCLEKYHHKKEKYLMSLIEKVQSGDPKNIEAQAAKFYWPHLFGETFTRSQDNTINASLNYGYAIIRSYISRNLTASGLFPAFGIHHNNQLNAFNLSDDIMELFRPFVDDTVFELYQLGHLGDDQLSPKLKQKLVNLVHNPCFIHNQNFSLCTAIEQIVFSLVKSMMNNDISHLLLPYMALNNGK